MIAKSHIFLFGCCLLSGVALILVHYSDVSSDSPQFPSLSKQDSRSRLLLSPRTRDPGKPRGGSRLLKHDDGPVVHSPTPGPGSRFCQGQCGNHNEQDSEGPCGKNDNHYGGECGYKHRGDRMLGGIAAEYEEADAMEGRQLQTPCSAREACPWKVCRPSRCAEVCEPWHVDGEVFKVELAPGNLGKTIRCFGYFDPNSPPRPPAPPLPTPPPTQPTHAPSPPPTVAGETYCEGQCGMHNEADRAGPCGADAHVGGDCGYRPNPCSTGASCPWLRCTSARCNAVCDDTRADGASFKIDAGTRGKTIRCWGYSSLPPSPTPPPTPPPPTATPTPEPTTVPTAPTPPPTAAALPTPAPVASPTMMQYCEGQCGTYLAYERFMPPAKYGDGKCLGG